MFIIELTYTKSLDVIDCYIQEHRQWLQTQYDKGLLLCSGPQNPRIGGFIIALGNDSNIIENMMKEDPFTLNNVSKYKITQFEPVKYHMILKDLLV